MAVLRVVVSEGMTPDSAFGIANVDKRLPDAESDFAQQMTKDPYNVDFMALRENGHEHTTSCYCKKNMWGGV